MWLFIPQNVGIDTKIKSLCWMLGDLPKLDNFPKRRRSYWQPSWISNCYENMFPFFYYNILTVLVKWHHNGCRYHIETFYEMSNCIYAPAMYCIGPSFGSHVGLYIFIHNPNLDWYKFTPYESMWLKSLMMEVCVKIPENKHIYSIDTFFISILKFVLFIML